MVADLRDKNWPFSSWGDDAVLPGDDFFRYTMGRWYDGASAGQGISYESLVKINKTFNLSYFINNPLPSLQTLLADTLRLEQDDVQQLSVAYTQQWIDRVNGAKTYSELGTVIGQLLRAGYEPALKSFVINYQGNMIMMLMSPTLMDDDDDDFRTSKRLDSRYTQQLRLMDATRAGSNFEAIIEAVAAQLNLVPGKTLAMFSDDEELAETLSLPLASLKQQIVNDIVKADLPLISRDNLGVTGCDNYLTYVTLLYNKYMNYEVAHYLYEQKFYDAERQVRLKALCSELITALKQRITNLTWMSAATKGNAKLKAESMRFFVGYPDTWYQDGLPQLSGNCMVEDVHQLMEANFNISLHVCGKTIVDAVPYLCVQNVNIASDNAFYQPSYNTFFIFPNYMFEPYFREDVLDAYMYGVIGGVIGHEMVHGFDNIGMEYDYMGAYAVSDEKPFGWWSEADYNEYVRRLGMLVASHGRVPFEPWIMPGCMSNGEATLGENIADLGGLEVALAAYTAHITEQGYSGKAVEDLQRLFFKAYAYSWRTKYNKSTLEFLLEKDVHSSYYARVIGPLQNCDMWYERFDVTEGQKYYLPAAQRCHLW